MKEEAQVFLQLELDDLIEEFKLLLYKIRDNGLLEKVNDLGNLEDIKEFCELLEFIGEQSTFILQVIKRHEENEYDHS